MTVIAWDGKTLAADRRAVYPSGYIRQDTKIHRHNGQLLAITGDADTGRELLAWYRAGAAPEAFPASARNVNSTLIVITHDGIQVFCSGPYPHHILEPQAAWGNGRDYAEAAMHLGLDARAAVGVACHFQSDCGDGVDTLTLDEPGQKVVQQTPPTSDTLSSIIAWQQRACPKPDERSRSVAVGVHLEEIAEMLWGLSLNRQGEYIEAVADSFKRHSSGAIDVLATYDRRAMLDALCDQIVTAVGIAHRFGFDIQGALAEVDRSNWSKLVDGQFQYDENGKVIKPESYSPPDLTAFV